MNCKLGDLAVIVRNWGPDSQRLLGIVCRVMAPVPGFWGPGWELAEPLPNGDTCIHDECLRPIRDSDGEDETLTWAGKPQEVTA
jgi:hypothetical protein